jgi:hypothetical protein
MKVLVAARVLLEHVAHLSRTVRLTVRFRMRVVDNHTPPCD